MGMPHPIVSLSTPSLLLRLPEPDDVDHLYEAVISSRELLAPWLPWIHADYGRADAAEWIASCAAAWERDENYAFSLFDPRSGALWGGCGLNFIDRYHQKANLGYWLTGAAQRRGLATEAARAVARFGLTSLGFERLEIVAAVHNIRSQRVAERAGAVREGVMRHRVLAGGLFCDAVGYSFIRDDLDKALSPS